MQYWSSNLCIGPSARIKVSLLLLPIYKNELISTSQITTFLPMLPLVKESSERQSNPMLYPLCLYLSSSAFLVSFKDPNKQLFNVKSVFKSLDHRSNV